MKTLNLVYKDKSDIDYLISKFPDGQQNVTLKNCAVAQREQVMIVARLNNWMDLEIIACATASLRAAKVDDICLYIPYILGARCDRQFDENGSRYLSQVLAPVINSLDFTSVIGMDPHSYVTENVIDFFHGRDNADLVNFAFENMYLQTNKLANCILVAPDNGASHKIYKIAEKIGYKGDVIICSKERDAEGKVTKTVVPNVISTCNKDYVIIDDICDGGRTFINIVKAIRETREFSSSVHPSQYGKFYLIVTHGIFSNGFYELAAHFDGIYCTNSYSDITKTVGSDKVKQLNVF